MAPIIDTVQKGGCRLFSTMGNASSGDAGQGKTGSHAQWRSTDLLFI